MDRKSRCQYCLQANPPVREHSVAETQSLRLEAFVRGLSTSACRHCKILLEAIQGLQPDLLQLLGSRAGDLSVHLFYNDYYTLWTRTERDPDAHAYDSLSIELYTAEDEDIIGQHGIESKREIATVAGAKPMWQFLRSCFSCCTREHKLCSQSQDRDWFPERLIYLDDAEDESTPCVLRLIDTKAHCPVSGYICLSYCWGRVPRVQTTTSNVDRFREGILWSELSKVDQDCVTVARELGFQYIWIDALCIVQDDRADWARTSQVMHQIFRNAILTVAAVGSDDTSMPFLGPEAPSRRADCQSIKIQSWDEQTGRYEQIRARRPSIPFSQSYRMNELLYSRAWAWQEHVFSCRIISFKRDKVEWTCKYKSFCESGRVLDHQSYAIETFDSAHTQADATRRYDIVSDYSNRQLTFWNDRLPALSGMAAYFGQDSTSRYFAGMWDDDFPRCLAWRRMSWAPSGGALNINVPSWSWASVPGEVSWLDKEVASAAGLQNSVEMVELRCYSSSENHFGELQPGSYIKLRGKTVTADLHVETNRTPAVYRNNYDPLPVNIDCWITGRFEHNTRRASLSSLLRHTDCEDSQRSTFEAKDNQERPGLRGRVLCLRLYTEQEQERMLILTPHSDYPGAYQRIGMAREYSYESKTPPFPGENSRRSPWFSNGKLRTVRIY